MTAHSYGWKQYHTKVFILKFIYFQMDKCLNLDLFENVQCKKDGWK